MVGPPTVLLGCTFLWKNVYFLYVVLWCADAEIGVRTTSCSGVKRICEFFEAPMEANTMFL